ncbi:hypothetical protein ACFS2C_06440 [Prauserella oleivorans]|uniref:Uncharacterized protein n=1 Tax=Prauserella oleivorans TaxID=1478153 RepID=A0ABW5W7D7_9PSEU
MTENPDLAPDADVHEQRQSIPDGSITEPPELDVPLEANPADAAEQAAAVPLDEEEHR